MYLSFTIKNFRCFHDLTIAPLERVNLIAGKNNVGKTALLEALFLHTGPNNPQLSVLVNFIRLGPTTNTEEMWGWLFFNKRIDESIELTSLREGNQKHSLKIRLVELKEPMLVPTGSGESTPTKGAGIGPQPSLLTTSTIDSTLSKNIGALATATGLRELILEYQDSAGQATTSRAFVTMDGIKVKSAQLAQIPPSLLVISCLGFDAQVAERFSNLDRKGRQGEVLAMLRLIEPRLKRLALLVTGSTPMIWGDIGISELVPLPLMGDGIVRLLSIVLAIANAPHGAVLVDEIENGLHHSAMVKVWKAIALAARQYDVQVFATTHSWECIQAAHTAFTEDGTYDFHLHRLDRINDEIRAVTYDQETLAAALKAELEVR